MRLLAATPPYRVYLEPDAFVPRRGQVLVVRLERSDATDPTIQARLQAMCRAAPWAHVLLHLPGVDPVAGALLVGFTGASGLTSQPEPDRDALLDLLASTEFDREVLQWVVERHGSLGRRVRGSVEALVLRGPRLPAEHWARSEAVRQRHRRAGIPSPDRFIRLMALLPLLLRLQRSRIAVNRVAIEGGWADGSALSESCRRLLGSRPSTLRRAVGWRWILWRRWALNASSATQLRILDTFLRTPSELSIDDENQPV